MSGGSLLAKNVTNKWAAYSRSPTQKIDMPVTGLKYVAIFVAISLFAADLPTLGQGKKLTTREAKNHIGHQATVCGRVANWRHESSRGNPTFLDLDKPYPNQPFSVVIWAKNRARFRDPEEYRNRNICVTGRIGSHRGQPEMIISNPTQLTADIEQSER